MPNPPRLIDSVDLHTPALDASKYLAHRVQMPCIRTLPAARLQARRASAQSRSRMLLARVHFTSKFHFSGAPLPATRDCPLLRPKVHGPASHAPLRETPPKQHNNANKTRSPSPSG